MKNWNFLKGLFDETEIEKDEEFDLKAQIKQYAGMLVKQYQKEFPNLDYSLKSFEDVDKIFKIIGKEYKSSKNNKQFVKIEMVSAYILYTLKQNYKGEILWNDRMQEPMFMFNNYKEFYPYQYIKKQIDTGKETALKELIEKLNKL